MKRVTIDFGAQLDLLDESDLDKRFDAMQEVWRQYAMGLKWVTKTGVLAKTTGTPGLASSALEGPRQGYVWMLTLLSIAAATAATVTLAIGDSGQYPIGVETLAAAGPAIFTFSSRQVILRSSDPLWVGASAGKLYRYRYHAIEAPAEQIFKLIGG